MSKFLNTVYKNSVWFIIALSLVAYLAYKTMTFSGEIIPTLQDWQTWVQVLFVIWLNVNMVSGAYDNGVSSGLNSDEFELADKLNNKIIESYNNEKESFREFVKRLNAHELLAIQEDYLLKVGDKKVEELTKKELKEYNNLKPVKHNIYGFGFPLYYTITKNGEIAYTASIKHNEGKRKAQIKKGFTGILFAAMTVNMIFQVGNLSDAIASLSIISVGLFITFIMNYTKQLFRFKFEIPKQVLLKDTLYNSYVDFKNGTHVLKKLNEPKIEQKIEEQTLSVS